MTITPRPFVLLLPMLITGCVLAPKETRDEQARLDRAGQPYEQEQRELPDLPTPATWRDVLERSLLRNGDLEASYFQWRAAMAQIPQNATWPNAMLAPSF